MSALSEALCSAQRWNAKQRKLRADKRRQAERDRAQATARAEWNKREAARVRLPYAD